MEPVRTSAPPLSSLKGHPESARIAFHVSGALALMQQHACNVQVVQPRTIGKRDVSVDVSCTLC